MADERRMLEVPIEEETAGMQPQVRLREGMTPTAAQMRAAAPASRAPQGVAPAKPATPPPPPSDSGRSARPK